MPSNKHNSIVAKATGLIFSLFDIASARQVLLAYCSMYNAFFMDLPASVLLCVSFIFADSEKCRFVDST